MDDIEERSGPEDDGPDQETDTLRDYRILWYSCDRERILVLLGADHHQLGLIEKLGLTETFRIPWPKAAQEGVLEFVRGFDMKTKTSQFRGRSFVLTKEVLRNEFKLPQGQFSRYKTKWYGVKDMFSSDRVDGNPNALKTLMSPYDEWTVVIRLVQELLLGKPKPSAVNGKEMWYFFAHLGGDPKKKRWKKSLQPAGMPDWADLVFDDLLTEINNLKKHLSQVGSPSIKKYPARCGTAVTYLLIQWGYSLVTLNGDSDSIGDKLANAAGRTLIAGEGSKDAEQWEEQNKGEDMALVPYKGPDQDVLKQAENNSNSQVKKLTEEVERLLQSNAKLEQTSEGLKKANGALVQQIKNANEEIGFLRERIRVLEDSNAALDSNSQKLIVELDEAKEAARTTAKALEAANAEVVAAEVAANLAAHNKTRQDTEARVGTLAESVKEMREKVTNQMQKIQDMNKEGTSLMAERQKVCDMYATGQQACNEKGKLNKTLQESLNEKTINLKEQDRQAQELDKKNERLLAETRKVDDMHATGQQACNEKGKLNKTLQESLNEKTNNLEVQERQAKELDKKNERLLAETRKVDQSYETIQQANKDRKEKTDALQAEQQAGCSKQQGSQDKKKAEKASNRVTPPNPKRKRPNIYVVGDDSDEEEALISYDVLPIEKWKVPKQEFRTKVDDSELNGSFDIPPEMTKGLNLLPHQKKGLHWMCSMENKDGQILGGILADDQGMGKTIQLIGLMLLHREKGAPTLIVCPNSVLYQWEQEIHDKVAKGYLSTLVYHGSGRHKWDSNLKTFDVVITTYGTVTSAGSEDALLKVDWLRAILDECHSIRNRSSSRALAVCKLGAEYRWCVSGTPISNSPFELYSYFKFLRYGPLHSDMQQGSHRRCFGRLPGNETLSEMHRHMVNTTIRRVKEVLSNLPEKIVKTIEVDFTLPTDRTLYSKLEDLIKEGIKRDERGHRKRNSKILVLFTKLRQVCLHRNLALKSFFREIRNIPGLSKETKEKLIAALWEIDGGKCAQCEVLWEEYVIEPSHVNICGHALCPDCVGHMEEWGDTMKCHAPHCNFQMKMKSLYTTDDLLEETEIDLARRQEQWMGFEADHSAPKFDAVIQYILTLPQYTIEGSKKKVTEKAIIFSQWPSVFPYLEVALRVSRIKYTRVDGSMKLPQRQVALKEFNTIPEVNVILLSMHATNTGLNITAANHVLLLDHWWNPSTEDQAVDRAHRIGQKRPVTVVHFVVKNTIESTIIARQNQKRSMARQCLYGPEGLKSRGEAAEVHDLMAEYLNRVS